MCAWLNLNKQYDNICCCDLYNLHVMLFENECCYASVRLDPCFFAPLIFKSWLRTWPLHLTQMERKYNPTLAASKNPNASPLRYEIL